jgi:hypothetical protein
MYSVPKTTPGHYVQRRPSILMLKITGYWLRAGSISGLVLGALFGSIFIPPETTVIGGFIGLLAGAGSGLMVGVLLALVTRLRFLPITNLERYLRTVFLTTSITNLAAGYLIPATVMGLLGGPGNPLEAIFSPGAVAFFGIPALIAALCSLFWKNRYIAWYSRNA